MVGDKVDNDLKPLRMSPIDKVNKLFKSTIGIICKIRIYIIIVSYGIGRSRIPLHNLGMGGNAAAVRAGGCMSDNTGIPYVIDTKSPEILQGPVVDIGKLSASPQTRKQLIYNLFQPTSSGSS